ncbi:MAG: sugar phosphate isomerase/epimerase and 4-hydroxyphenylpyruvate domain-containing protein [Betaproteobacteria bacterium]|nr:MAG: sugar phosphate isomerase/epimerase and 4-hydroxyphenylpyruvate domain-containing protein [Betaproteobacteria bacterium]
MRKCIATVSLSGTLSEKLDAIAAARFDAIEVFENDLIHFQGSPEDVRAMAADRGLGIDLYQPFRDLDAATDEQVRRNLDRAERKFDIMETLGAPMMLVCSNPTPGAVTDDARIAAQFHALADRAARRNLRIAFEALAWGRHVSRYSHAWSIVKAADHPHLGVALDSFHTLSLGDDPAGIAEIPGDKIFFLQLADAPRLAMDVLQWSRHYRCFPGQGQFDLARFLECVLIAGYNGPLSLEIFNDVFREAPGRRTAIDAMQSLLYLESQTRQRLASAAAANPQSSAAQALGRVALFDPPQPPRLDGVAFLEFAVDTETETALGGLLESLGFARAGRHRSKEVSLYQQGDINLVLNAEPDSFARTHFSEHGPSICAMSLTTDDSIRALNRATALNCPRFDSRIGPHELKIPAIRAPDGSLVYFVPAELGSDGLYEIDFDLTARPRLKGVDAGLASIDHVAIGLPVDALDTWILFYRAVLGMQPGDSLELSDPYGLIRSCGVASDNRAVRVVLNVSQSRSTQTARAVTSQGGAGVHHIAFACNDIFATLEKLIENGVRFVPISPNYYDDLLARFDLPTSVVARMRRLSILYERSGGEYFHAYSEPFAGRFFFEIVQRTGDYDGYGALNAPARIASQAQRSAAMAHP